MSNINAPGSLEGREIVVYRAAQVGRKWQVGPRRMERICRAFESIGHAIHKDGDWLITNDAVKAITERSWWEAGRKEREGCKDVLRDTERDARASDKVYSGAMLDLAIDNLFNGDFKPFGFDLSGASR